MSRFTERQIMLGALSWSPGLMSLADQKLVDEGASLDDIRELLNEINNDHRVLVSCAYQLYAGHSVAQIEDTFARQQDRGLQVEALDDAALQRLAAIATELGVHVSTTPVRHHGGGHTTGGSNR